MNGEILYTRTEDGLALEGLCCSPSVPAVAGRTAFLHCHGFAGNFYANRFVDEIARVVTNRGHTFLSVNTRGHDSVAESHRQGGAESATPATSVTSGYVLVGSAHEGLRGLRAGPQRLDGDAAGARLRPHRVVRPQRRRGQSRLLSGDPAGPARGRPGVPRAAQCLGPAPGRLRGAAGAGPSLAQEWAADGRAIA